MSFVSLTFIFIPLPRRMPICKMLTVFNNNTRYGVVCRLQVQASFRCDVRQHEFGCKCKYLHHPKDRPSSSVTSPPVQGHFACSGAISDLAAVRGGVCSCAAKTRQRSKDMHATSTELGKEGKWKTKGKEEKKKRRREKKKQQEESMEGTIHPTVGSRYW